MSRIAVNFFSIAVMQFVVVQSPSAIADQVNVDQNWNDQQQEIIDIVAGWPFGIHEDFDGWVAGYHPQWTYWEVGTDNLRTRSEHMDRVSNYIGSGAEVLNFQITPKAVNIQGDIAVIRYSAVETIREASESVIDIRFSSANIFMKHEGNWKLFSTNILYLDDE